MLSQRYKVLILFFIFSLSLKLPIFAQSLQDPAASLLPQEETTTTSIDKRYSAEEFSALSDAEKRDVYFNKAQLLPENFSPENYIDIFYPELKKVE